MNRLTYIGRVTLQDRNQDQRADEEEPHTITNFQVVRLLFSIDLRFYSSTVEFEIGCPFLRLFNLYRTDILDGGRVAYTVFYDYWHSILVPLADSLHAY